MKKLLYILIILLITSATYGQDVNSPKTINPAFVHTVFFWLNNPESNEDRAQFETSLNEFLNTSQYAKTNYVGTPPIATRDVVDASFTYCLIVSFESAQTQDNYQNEKAHLKFIEEAKDLWNKVIVYDSQGIQSKITKQ